MPTYDYRCLACKHEFEHYQSMKDKPLKKCPSCGKASLERLIGTGAAVIFKGSGFYQTDYRSEGYRKSAEADKPAAPAVEPAKSETAPAPAAAKPDGSKPAAPKAAEPAKPAATKEPAKEAAPAPKASKSAKKADSKPKR